jgi:hypothetical protein
MKKTLAILLGATAIAAIAVVVYRKRNRNTGHMLKQVAEEGYETAHDVLFPQKLKGGKNLRYGPVLPQ